MCASVATVPAPSAAVLPRAADRAAIARCANLAVQRGLAPVPCSFSPAGPGSPAWVVASHSRPGLSHLVWLAEGRLLCSCPARTSPRVFTCSHAQAVRLSLAAAASLPASRPTAYVESMPSTASGGLGLGSAVAGCATLADVVFVALTAGGDPDPDPTPPAAPAPAALPVPATPEPEPINGGFPPLPPLALCPSCGMPLQADELAQLGECLRCLMAGQVCPPDAAAIVEEIETRAGAGVAHVAHCPHCLAEADAEQLARYGACPRCIASNPTGAGRGPAGPLTIRPRPSRATVAARIIASEEQRQRRYHQLGRETAGDPRPEQAEEERRERRREAAARRREARETARDIEGQRPADAPDPTERKPRKPRKPRSAARPSRAIYADQIEREELPPSRNPAISMWR
jgi:hypothetical protein